MGRLRPKEVELVIRVKTDSEGPLEILRIDLRSLAAFQELMQGKDILEYDGPITMTLERIC